MRQAVDYNGLFGVEAKYGYRYFEEMVVGSDTFRLMTRIYLPEGEGPWPVVVTRTPYVAYGDDVEWHQVYYYLNEK